MTEAAPAVQNSGDAPEPQVIKTVIHFGPGVTPPEGVAVVSNAEAQRAIIDETFRALGIPEDVLAQRRAGTPVSEQELNLAMHRKKALMQDKEWVKRYLDGGVNEKREFGILHIILGSTIKKDDANG